MLDIAHLVTAPYHPTAHGIVEREHLEILDKTQKFIMDCEQADKDNWSTFIPLVNRILNSHIHSAIGITPYELVFGTRMATDMKMLQSDLPVKEEYLTPEGFKGKGPDAYVRALNNAVLKANDHALIHLQDLIMKNHEKASTTDIQYKEGDYVLYANNRYATKKLLKFAPSWAGPVKVIKQLQGDFYKLHDLVQDLDMLSHASDMRLFPCDNDEKAIEVARHDYKETTVSKVLSHSGGTPNGPPLLFELESNKKDIFWLPFKDIRFIPIVEKYVKDNKSSYPELQKLKFQVNQTLTARARKGRGHTEQGHKLH